MSDKIKVAAIIGASAFACVSLVTYCSPYQTCVRAARSGLAKEGSTMTIEAVQIRCAAMARE